MPLTMSVRLANKEVELIRRLMELHHRLGIYRSRPLQPISGGSSRRMCSEARRRYREEGSG